VARDAHHHGLGMFSPIKTDAQDCDSYWPKKNFPDSLQESFFGMFFASLHSSAMAMRIGGNVRVVLIGSQGTGKTTLFNRLTGATQETSSGVKTCTRTNTAGRVQTPVANLNHVEIVDSPGSASEDVHYDDSFELREALVRKPVNLIVVVMACPQETRSSTAITSLKPLDKIMNCNAFLMDQYGVTAARNGSGKSSRTKVMLAMTHKDKFGLDPSCWDEYVRDIRIAYPWVGPVVFMDTKRAPLSNLMGNIVIPAMCMDPRDYSIPMVEFCARFPIAREMSCEDQDKVLAKQNEFNTAMVAAMAKFNETKAARALSGSSVFLEKVGPSLDCVIRFMDDIYERKTLEALAVLERVPVDDLWINTEEAINLRRVEKWNAIKSHFGEAYEINKRILAQAFPTRQIDAIYKRCPHCKCVYVKPVGCDFGTRCGKSAGGSDTLPFTYSYEASTNRFDILESSSQCLFERAAYTSRRQFAAMQRRFSQAFWAEEETRAPTPPGSAGFEKGCNREIRWETMTPLTLQEMKDLGLIPEYIEYAVTASATAGTGFGPKVQQIKQELGITGDIAPKALAERAWSELELDPATKPQSLAQQLDHLLAELGC